MEDKKFPNRLYVAEKDRGWPMSGLKYLEGTGHLESLVPDNNEETTVAVYELVRVEKYKKLVTRTEVVEKVSY